jgi:O-glycosyl hydrolase
MKPSSAPKILTRASILFFSWAFMSAVASATPVANAHSDNRSDTVRLQLFSDQTFQVMDNFGASDAWACQYVGLWKPTIKNKIADLLFSQRADRDGNPLGIGLSAWRFNIGAGSTDQGDKSGIKDPWRRTESFLDSDGSYDFSKAVGQRWFLKAAKNRGVEDFIGFCNSAPYQLTSNHLTYGTGGKSNLGVEKYKAFADFLVEVIKGVKKSAGVLFNYISPVNEPQWDWSDGGQEGSPYNNDEIASLSRVLNKQLEAAHLPTKLSIAEAGEIDYLYAGGNKPRRGRQIQQFFSPNSSDALVKLNHLSHKIAAHSYFTTSPIANGIALREKVRNQLAMAKSASGLQDLGYWMSEYCILGDNHGEIDGSHRDLGMTSALYLAKVVFMDLCYANASAWHWWLALSPYDYKDGLIYVDKTDTTGNFYVSKMLWTLGNYSRFIRPGYRRIGTKFSIDNPKDSSLFVSAFKDLKSKKFVIVLVNTGHTGKQVQLDNSQILIKDKYITSDKYNLKHFSQTDGRIVALLPSSVTTLTCIYK